VLADLLDARRVAPLASLDDLLRTVRAIDRPPFEAAVVGGALADRVGYAFVAGIRSAVARLLPGLPKAAIPALCITEARGGHPRDIETRFDDAAGKVEGRKHWATLATRADVLFVLAKAGEAEGRPLLRLVEVDPHADGVRIEPMPETPFAPEVPHAVVTFADARVIRVLEGDGFER
jgi:acyl-CoA dehydrogenase